MVGAGGGLPAGGAVGAGGGLPAGGAVGAGGGFPAGGAVGACGALGVGGGCTGGICAPAEATRSARTSGMRSAISDLVLVPDRC